MVSEITCPVALVVSNIDWYTFQTSLPVCFAICDFKCVFSRTSQTLLAGVTNNGWINLPLNMKSLQVKKGNSRKK